MIESSERCRARIALRVGPQRVDGRPMLLDYFTPSKSKSTTGDARAARRRLAESIAAFMRGDIDNFAFDDAVWAAEAGDRSIGRLPGMLWMLYDDVRRHPISVDRRGWQFLRRCVAYLCSVDTPVPKYRPKITDLRLWPFDSWPQVRAAAKGLASIPLPVYDPAIHRRKIRWPDIRPAWFWAVVMSGMVLIGLIVWRLI